MTLRTALLFASAAACLSGGAQAQPAQSTPQLEEIVVTAQKREESLQSVPIAVTAVTASTLTRQNVATTRDLQFVVPSLVYNQLSGYGQPFLRGIGSDLVGPNSENGVATYVDGVVVSSNSGTIQGLLGVQRVEVLAGPQGTLYGRNAVGGTINVYTLTPGSEFEANASATVGNYNRRELSARVSGPVSDTLSLGIYTGFSQRDTYLKLVQGRVAGQPAHERDLGARIKAVWTPTDDVRLTASAERTVSRNIEGGAYRNAQPDALAYLFGAPNFSGQKYVVDSDFGQFNKPKQWAATLRTEVDMGWAKLLGITGYRDLDADGGGDVDGTSVPLLGSNSVPLVAEQISQELQLLSPDESRLKWIVGGYYFHEKGGYGHQNVISLAGALPPPITRIDNGNDIRTRSLAVFGQVTAPLDMIAPGLNLTVGGRYTVDRKRFSATARFYDAANTQLGPTTVYPDDSESWKEFTPKVTLDYQIGQTLLYATYSKGFKAGAYNPSTPSAPGPVDPETLTALEAGFKSTFAGRVRLNAATYYYKFKDIQVSRVELGTTQVQNAASAKAYGIEGSLTAAVTNELTLTASGSLEHTEYSRFPNASTNLLGPAGNPSAAVNASGNPLIRAPKIVFNVGAEYNQPLSNGGAFNASANWYYNDGYAWEATNRFRQSSYSLVNASVGYTFPGETLAVRGWVNNLTNSYYRNQLILTPVSVIVQDAAPRMYGVTLTVSY